jgi:threonine/homoserine/homoserine lactone efflux protein
MIYILFMGFLVSFLGQLPLGNMSFTSTQVCIQEGFKKAWEFAMGVAIVEMIYLRFALTGMDWIVRHRIWFIALGWITVVMFFVLGIMAFVTANKQHGEKKALVLDNKLNRFVLGLMNISFNLFTAGAGMGTLSGLAVYIHGGNWLVSKMNTSHKTLNKIMGVIFMITALIQLYRMLYKPWI